jgi:hypothetical protein
VKVRQWAAGNVCTLLVLSAAGVALIIISLVRFLLEVLG